MALKITNGVKKFFVTRADYNRIYKPQGFYPDVKNSITGAQVGQNTYSKIQPTFNPVPIPEETINPKIYASDGVEAIAEEDIVIDPVEEPITIEKVDLFANDPIEDEITDKPLSRWTKAECEKYATDSSLDFEGITTVKDMRAAIKKHMSE